MKLRRFFVGMLVFLAVPVFAKNLNTARSDDTACRALVERAFLALASNCTNLDRDQVCYGFPASQAGFSSAAAHLAQPGDRASVADLVTVHTLPLNLDQQEWGLAAFKLQAGIPRILSDQGVTLVLMGDAAIENAVPAGEALQLADPITVTTLVGTNIRSAPDQEARLLGSVPAGTDLLADGVSPDGGWLRVAYEGALAWASRTLLLESAGTADALPVISENSLTAMQAFRFSTGSEAPPCDGAPPPLLLIQGPEGVSTRLVVNGATIYLNSTIVLRQANNFMLLAVLEGEVRLDNLLVPEGFGMMIPLENGQAAGPWMGFALLSGQQLTDLIPLESLPVGIVREPLAIAALEKQVHCVGFRPTLPLDRVAYGPSTFYWDGAYNATNYRVNFYTGAGAFLVSVETGSSNTNITVDMALPVFGTESVFLWEVQALSGGQIACTSEPITVLRDSAPGAVVPVGEGDGGDTGDNGDGSGPPGPGGPTPARTQTFPPTSIVPSDTPVPGFTVTPHFGVTTSTSIAPTHTPVFTQTPD